MSNKPLMPKATAVWLVDNTSLSFEQIADFCHLHTLEVSAIADGDAAQGIKGMDPIATGQLTREEIEKGQKDSSHKLELIEQEIHESSTKQRRKHRYTPLSRRQDRPNAILWLLRNHQELRDAQIIRLVGTTKNTISAVRERTHWNSANLVAMDPVTLKLCNQGDLDKEVERAAKDALNKPAPAKASTILPVEETTSEDAMVAALGYKQRSQKDDDIIDPDSVFTKSVSKKK